jgi:methionyl-tRNA formyltransferase
MQMDEGLDTGPVLACERTPIDPDETSADLGARLSLLGAKLVRERLRDYVEGHLESVPQDHARATLAPLLKKEDGALDWSATARRVHDRVRAMVPWPGAYAVLGQRVKVHRTRVVQDDGVLGEPGVVLEAGPGGIVVACGSGAVALLELQHEGRKRLTASQFLSGQAIRAGERFEPKSVEAA